MGNFSNSCVLCCQWRSSTKSIGCGNYYWCTETWFEWYVIWSNWKIMGNSCNSTSDYCSDCAHRYESTKRTNEWNNEYTYDDKFWNATRSEFYLGGNECTGVSVMWGGRTDVDTFILESF